MATLDKSPFRQRTLNAAASAFAFAVLMATPALAATLYVANNGTDDATCGPEGMAPCRSISRAIAHASAGDEIVVGPGVYGDIDRSGSVDPGGDSGEESPVSVAWFSCGLLSGVNLALIHVDKPLSIVSRDGAGSTVIDAGGQFYANYVVVDIAADDVVFGKRGKGFTVRNGAVAVHVNAGVVNAAVQGNLLQCYLGALAGDCTEPPQKAIGTVLKGNTSVPESIAGFLVIDDSATVSGNLAKGSLFYGFTVLGGEGTTITKNLAVDGFTGGFLVSSESRLTFSRNAAIGNSGAGLTVTSMGTVAAEVTVEKNALFGNGKRPQYPPPNCGLVIQNSGAAPLTVNADGNWWGAATGPGSDPADDAGGTCVAGVVTLNLAEWAAKEIRVKPPSK